MNNKVKIHIEATGQETTALCQIIPFHDWDNYGILLHKIPDLKLFEGYSNVIMKWDDGSVRNMEFCCQHQGMLIQREYEDMSYEKLEIWMNGSDNKAMTHNVTITKEENRVIEEYWVMLAKKSVSIAEYDMSTHISKKVGNKDLVEVEKELGYKPTRQEIAQFLSETQADFVSVEHNYRFKTD